MEEAAAAGVAAPDISSPSPRIRPAPVRVVAKIYPGGGSTGSFQVSTVSDEANSSSATVSFIPITKDAKSAVVAGSMTPRKNSECELDWCYLKDDPCTRIFDKEVKPLIDAVLSGVRRKNACVITCGAAAKIGLIKGSQDHPGLLIMAMKKILDSAKLTGAAVSVSSYQVLQDSHVFDLLEPKDSEVLVLDDADGKTHLKGLFRVDIKSIGQFENLCCGGNKIKHPTKASNQLQARGHKGFNIYISRLDQHDRECSVATMSFLDLAGYTDTKQKNKGGGTPSNSNKSLYAVMDVVQALNSNDRFIPYRKSKITHILQDSLCKTSVAVLIACLDEVSCQDAVCTLGLASRSSQVVNYSLSLGTRNSSKSKLNLSVSTKNLSRSLLPAIQQRSSVLQKNGTPTANTRNLFCQSTNLLQEDRLAVVPTAVTKAEGVQPSVHMAIQAPSPTEVVVPCSKKELASSDMQEKDPLCALVQDHSSSDLPAENSYADLGMTCITSDMQEKDCSTSDSSAENSSGMTCSSDAAVSTTQSSLKLSDELKVIVNKLKLLSTRPVSITKQKTDMVYVDVAEPKTPAAHLKFRQAEDLQDSLKACSTGIKKSLAQECLTFLNSANKEQLKSLKGIGEKRANFILELREESPEPFKEIEDFRSIMRMNNKEIKTMVSGMILDTDMD